MLLYRIVSEFNIGISAEANSIRLAFTLAKIHSFTCIQTGSGSPPAAGLYKCGGPNLLTTPLFRLNLFSMTVSFAPRSLMTSISRIMPAWRKFLPWLLDKPRFSNSSSASRCTRRLASSAESTAFSEAAGNIGSLCSVCSSCEFGCDEGVVAVEECE